MLKPLLLVSAAALCLPSNAHVLNIPATVKAKNTQVFYAPMPDSWRSQIEWMLPEGEVAQAGEAVVVYDSGSIASSIEQDEVALTSAHNELKRLKSNNQQALMEAEFALKRSELIIQKAKIDAAIPKGYISEFDYEQNQLALEKAYIEKAKTTAKLDETKLVTAANQRKQQLNIEQIENRLDYNRTLLNTMSLNAQNQGPILYANHPWRGEKLFSGSTVNPGWKVAEIPSTGSYYLEAWIHEVDINKVESGIQATLTLDAYAESPINATLSEISTQSEKQLDWGQSVYYQAKFEFIPPPDMNILPGMSANLELQGGKNASK